MKNKASFALFTVIFWSALILPCVLMAQEKSDHDTSYYVTYPGTLVGRFYFSKKYTSFTLPSSNDGEDIKYKPNTLLTMGLGVTYNNLTLNLSYGFDFLNKSNDDKGKTKSIDLQAHFFPRKWALDLIAIRHKALYLEREDYTPDNPGSYYYRPDVEQLFIGFAGYKVMNPERFSFNAAMMQNEWQKKSAGSLLLGGLIYYGQMKGDSSLIPAKIQNAYPQAAGIDDINSLSLGIGVGYAYTLVIAKHFYITGSAIGNINANFSTVENMDDKKNNTSINPFIIYKAAIGYNSDSWDISGNWAASDLWFKGGYFSNDFHAPVGNYRVILSKKIALKKH
jgi:hypothetical protein